jgi:hypothetical protein
MNSSISLIDLAYQISAEKARRKIEISSSATGRDIKPSPAQHGQYWLVSSMCMI